MCMECEILEILSNKWNLREGVCCAGWWLVWIRGRPWFWGLGNNGELSAKFNRVGAERNAVHQSFCGSLYPTWPVSESFVSRWWIIERLGIRCTLRGLRSVNCFLALDSQKLIDRVICIGRVGCIVVFGGRTWYCIIFNTWNTDWVNNHKLVLFMIKLVEIFCHCFPFKVLKAAFTMVMKLLSLLWFL